MFVLSSRLTYIPVSNFLTVETELHGQGLGLVLRDCQTKYEISPNPVATVSCNVLVFYHKKASSALPLPSPITEILRIQEAARTKEDEAGDGRPCRQSSQRGYSAVYRTVKPDGPSLSPARPSQPRKGSRRSLEGRSRLAERTNWRKTHLAATRSQANAAGRRQYTAGRKQFYSSSRGEKGRSVSWKKSICKVGCVGGGGET
jgi:hypothetical protein